jgi:hypothetical protein
VAHPRNQRANPVGHEDLDALLQFDQCDLTAARLRLPIHYQGSLMIPKEVHENDSHESSHRNLVEFEQRIRQAMITSKSDIRKYVGHFCRHPAEQT